tara:strand:- start:1453 stop:1734 length:282 start_codon:yes stop_codon:yes gene_type:complete
MKKSQLEKLIKVELKKLLSESAGRMESFVGQKALSRAAALCRDALDPKAVGAELDEPTQESFREIYRLIGAAFDALVAKNAPKSGMKMPPLGK